MKTGRPKKIRFPIVRTEVMHGTARVRMIEENMPVTCVRCGEFFLINGDTAYVSRDEADSRIEMVYCPQCGRRASVYHYYDRRTKMRKSKRRNHS